MTWPFFTLNHIYCLMYQQGFNTLDRFSEKKKVFVSLLMNILMGKERKENTRNSLTH